MDPVIAQNFVSPAGSRRFCECPVKPVFLFCCRIGLETLTYGWESSKFGNTEFKHFYYITFLGSAGSFSILIIIY